MRPSELTKPAWPSLLPSVGNGSQKPAEASGLPGAVPGPGICLEMGLTIPLSPAVPLAHRETYRCLCRSLTTRLGLTSPQCAHRTAATENLSFTPSTTGPLTPSIHPPWHLSS